VSQGRVQPSRRPVTAQALTHIRPLLELLVDSTTMSTPSGSSGTAAGGEAEFAWLFDFVVSFLRSPAWTTPLNNFIDEHCGVFTVEDENKLVYTEIHQKFCSLVEGLLSKNLSALGISDEAFVAAVASGASSDQGLQRVIFGQVLAVDDFLTFKKMMAQRNAELESESMRTLATYSPSDEEEAELQLELALALSQAEISGPKDAAAKKAAFSEDDLAAALRLSMLDTEKAQSEYEREQAELEHAIALSLAAEAERLRLREEREAAEREEAERAAAAKLAAAAAPAKAAPAPAAAEAPKAAAPAAVPAPGTAAASALPVVFGEPVGAGAKKPLPPMTIKAPAGLGALPPLGGGSASSSGAAASGSKLGALPPMIMKQSSLVPLEVEKAAHDANVRLAEEAFAANQRALREAKKAAKKAEEEAAKAAAAAAASSGNKSGPSEEELARRKEFLLRQRELLLKKKKAERDGDLEKFEAERAAIESSSASSSSSSSSSAPGAPRALTEAELLALKQEAMKSALVTHLKNVHHDVEAKRAGMAKEENAQKTLQQQMAEMEQLRAQKLAGLQREQEDRLKQEEERRRALQQFQDKSGAN